VTGPELWAYFYDFAMRFRVAFLVILLMFSVGAAVWSVALEKKNSRITLRTIWDGVYTAEQAARGRALYADRCITCHKEDLSGMKGRLVGQRFMDDWREDSLNPLFARTKAGMPPVAPGSLTDREYIDILAYLFQQNGFPSGRSELKRNELTAIQFLGKDGPQPLPHRAAVFVVGCFSKG